VSPRSSSGESFGSHARDDLTPRACVITPGSNAVILAIFNDGNLLFDGTVPITGATGRLNVPALTAYRALSFFGRSANVTATLAYGVGRFKGTVLGAEVDAYRSGLLDSAYRFSVNLKGAPAMGLGEMRQWRQKTLLGASFKVIAPTGQYDPTKLVNLGGNRWAFKPELGLSQRWGHWVLDAYASVWLFTKNPEFFSRNAYVPGIQQQTQDPVTAFETHVSYDVRPGCGSRSMPTSGTEDGRRPERRRNPRPSRDSRIGLTASFPSRRQALRSASPGGAYVRFGATTRSPPLRGITLDRQALVGCGRGQCNLKYFLNLLVRASTK
jgi:hypothetical protein